MVMASKTTYEHWCDICGDKVDSLFYFYYGEMKRYGSHSSSSYPENKVECCLKCRDKLSAIIGVTVESKGE